jgi:hypothetical protein
MKMNRAAVYAVMAACAFVMLFASSCATSRGSTLGKVLSAQAGSSARANPPSQPSEEPSPSPLVAKRGLEVISSPDNAEVWIDGAFRGLSPYIAENIAQGWHRVTIRREGYYEASGWVDFESDYMLYQATLTRITGFLQLSVSPLDSFVTVGGQRVSPGLQQFPVGSFTVVTRSFGYADDRRYITIQEKSVTALDVALTPAEFTVTSFSVPKRELNPANPGIIGTLECKFSVTGPGGGELKVYDLGSEEVFSQTLPEFTTWDQSFAWNVRDSSGSMLPDGIYRLTIDVHGRDSEIRVQREAQFRVDSTLKVAPRSVWSGSAGLLYAPVAEVLPEGDFQVAMLGAGISGPGFFQVPIQLGARIGIGKKVEIDASAGIIASSVAVPFTASVAGRWNFVSPQGAFGTGSAVQAKLSLQYNPAPGVENILITDTFANFTGISVEVPFQLSLGAVNLMLSAGVTGSLWYPYRMDLSYAPIVGPVAWLYLRAGVMLEAGSVMAGLSASTRTQPLPGGVAFLSSPIPFQAGGEIHWLIPGTRLTLTGMIAGEYEDANDYYFMGGAGLGFLY